MPEAKKPPMNMKADGARSIPPEITKPLVQPPAMPAAYSMKMAPKNASTAGGSPGHPAKKCANQ